MAKGNLPVKYLGVPLYSDYVSAAQCIPLMHKITMKLDSWDSNLLSTAGRARLI